MENIGTLSYTAPEVYANRGAALAADNWSLGVVLYVMITGTNPFRVPGRKVDKEETVRRIRSGDFEQRRQSWLNVSVRGQDLIRRFLVLSESERLTCKRALQHQWLQEFPNPSDGGVFSGVPTVLSCVSSQQLLAQEAPKVMLLLQHVLRLSAAQRVAIECCALAATEADLNSTVPWRDLFIALDHDQDGRLSLGEFAVGLQTLAGSAAPRNVQLEDSIQALDFDGSGYVEWVEWLVIALLSSKGIAEACEPLSTAFRLIDRTAETSDPAAEEGTQESISELIARSAPRMSGVISNDAVCTLQDLRFVLASLEVYEIM
jgi:Ca2+-binding EF-hand superfamily protein